MQAWDRFLVVYKDLIVHLKAALCLEPTAGQAKFAKDLFQHLGRLLTVL